MYLDCLKAAMIKSNHQVDDKDKTFQSVQIISKPATKRNQQYGTYAEQQLSSGLACPLRTQISMCAYTTYIVNKTLRCSPIFQFAICVLNKFLKNFDSLWTQLSVS